MFVNIYKYIYELKTTFYELMNKMYLIPAVAKLNFPQTYL